MYGLSGPELSKFIKKEQQQPLVSADTSDSIKASYNLLSRWLHKLHSNLLPDKQWSASDIDTWRGLVHEIQSHWKMETLSSSFPQLHMLKHTVEFAENHHMLGAASEAQIESCHYKFNVLFHKQHLNMRDNTAERLRRSLADMALAKVKPIAIDEI